MRRARMRPRRVIQMRWVRSGDIPLWQRINDTQPADQVGQWRIAEASGTTAVDSSAQANNGTHSDVTLGVAGPDGLTVGSYGSTPSYTNIYSAGLNADFNGQEGAVVILGKVSGAGILADGLSHQLFRIRVSSTHYVLASTNNTTLSFIYRAGGVSKTFNHTISEATVVNNWFVLFANWSLAGDAASMMFNGVQSGATQTGLGTWSGVLAATTCAIGAADNAGATYWDGLLGRCTFWNTPVSLATGATLVL